MAHHWMGEARYEIWRKAEPAFSGRVFQNDQLRRQASPRQRILHRSQRPTEATKPSTTATPVYEQTLLYPPFAIFDVDVVNAVLSNLSSPTVSISTSPQLQWDSDSHRLEVQTLEALLIGIDIDEPTKEGDATGVSIARELTLERGIVAAIGRMCHRNRLRCVGSATPLCHHNRKDVHAREFENIPLCCYIHTLLGKPRQCHTPCHSLALSPRCSRSWRRTSLCWLQRSPRTSPAPLRPRPPKW